MFCRKCGSENPEDSRFCESCGTPFSASSSQRTSSPGARSALGRKISGAEGAHDSSPHPNVRRLEQREGLP